MNKKYKKLFTIYYILPILSGIFWTIIILSGRRMSFDKMYKAIANGTLNLSIFSYIFSIIEIITLIMSIALIILIFIKKLKKINLIYPIYHIIWNISWLIIMPLLTFCFCYNNYTPLSEKCVIENITNLQSYDIIFYLINIILPLYLLDKLYKK